MVKSVFRWWAGLVILAAPKTMNTSPRRLNNIVVARLFVAFLPLVLLFTHLLFISLFPSLIHFSAVTLLFVLIPMFVIGMWRLHKLKVYFQRRQNTSE